MVVGADRKDEEKNRGEKKGGRKAAAEGSVSPVERERREE
jgi:hypothetical protein